MNPVLAAWLVEVGLITWRGAIEKKYVSNPIPHLALPSEYAATVIIFGGLSLIPTGGNAAKIAGAFSWGLVLATALNLWTPSPPGSPIKVVPGSPIFKVPNTTKKKGQNV